MTAALLHPPPPTITADVPLLLLARGIRSWRIATAFQRAQNTRSRP